MKFDIIWDLSHTELWDYLKQFLIEEFPEYRFITNDLRTGYDHRPEARDLPARPLHHLAYIDNNLYYTQWGSGGQGDESWTFYRIYDVDKFLNNRYKYWELVKDTFENFDDFYKISFSTRNYSSTVAPDTLDIRMQKSSYNNKYCIPTNKIPRNILPATKYSGSRYSHNDKYIESEEDIKNRQLDLECIDRIMNEGDGSIGIYVGDGTGTIK